MSKMITYELASGEKVEAITPETFSIAEFTLSGNAQVFEESIAVYDPTTDTGGLYSRLTAGWTFWQPVGREDFFRMVTITRQQASKVEDLCESMKQEYIAQAVAAGPTGTMH